MDNGSLREIQIQIDRNLMHIPTHCTTEIPSTPIRLALFGAYGTGKTEAALTFPNPIFMDWDNGLIKHIGEKITRAPFCDIGWATKLYPGVVLAEYAAKKWLETEAVKFGPEQTLVWDSYTAFQDVMVGSFMRTAPISKQGEKDKRTAWGSVVDFHRDIHIMLCGLACNVVVILHEQIQRTEEGSPNGKIEPLLMGQFKDKFSKTYTDIYRQLAVTDATTKKTEYLWQVRSDSVANCKSRMTIAPEVTRLPATYKSFTYKKV